MNRLACRDIGYRAAELIQSRAKLEGISCSDVMKRLGMDRKSFFTWKSGDFAPSTFALNRMAWNGFDVNYILTGKTKES